MSSAFGRGTRAVLEYCLPIALLLSLTACKDDSRSYNLGGEVSGLSAPGLVLTNNGSTPLSVSQGSSSFAFPDRVRKSSQYSVAVATQPLAQICTVTNGSGTVHRTVTDIRVACSAETHSVAGSIAGLATAGLVLQMNGADDLAISANAGSFEFETPIAAGSGYRITVLTQPAGLNCTVNNGTASNINADIHNVQVVCSTTTHSVSGTIAGLTGAGLVLRNNGADDFTAAAGSSSFQFASPIADGGAYTVTVLSQPAGQACSIVNGSGTAQSNVTNIAVTCANVPTYTITASAGANGSISPSGAVSVNQGDSIGFVATAAAGYGVSQWLVDGAPVQTGGSMYSLTNVSGNATVQVNFSGAVLTASVQALALSVNDTTTDAALTGSPRTITITNAGSTAATNVVVSAPTLPSGTSITSDSCSATTLAPSSSCSVTVTPGSVATSSCTSGIAPTPNQIIVDADNTADASINVFVLGYACIFEGGYLFSVDDTTATTSSIGGKVAATTDQAPAYPNGIIWSSNGNGPTPADVDYQYVGLLEGTTTPCVADHEGGCNTTTILNRFPANSYPRTYFAAGLCALTNAGGYSDWYLPAHCEATSAAGSCPAGGQSMQAKLVDYSGLNLAGGYWTSTEQSILGTGDGAYGAIFAPGFNSTIGWTKEERPGVRCVRKLSP